MDSTEAAATDDVIRMSKSGLRDRRPAVDGAARRAPGSLQLHGSGAAAIGRVARHQEEQHVGIGGIEFQGPGWVMISSVRPS